MPIFEFQCRKCGAGFEVFFRSRDEKLAVACPQCLSKKVERQMSTFSGKIGNTSAGGTGCGNCTATSCGPS
jgi:putative FmdB family regulatory protein